MTRALAAAEGSSPVRGVSLGLVQPSPLDDTGGTPLAGDLEPHGEFGWASGSPIAPPPLCTSQASIATGTRTRARTRRSPAPRPKRRATTARFRRGARAVGTHARFKYEDGRWYWGVIDGTRPRSRCRLPERSRRQVARVAREGAVGRTAAAAPAAAARRRPRGAAGRARRRFGGPQRRARSRPAPSTRGARRSRARRAPRSSARRPRPARARAEVARSRWALLRDALRPEGGGAGGDAAASGGGAADGGEPADAPASSVHAHRGFALYAAAGRALPPAARDDDDDDDRDDDGGGDSNDDDDDDFERVEYAPPGGVALPAIERRARAPRCAA